MKTSLLIVLFWSTLIAAHAQKWETVTHDGRDYVTMDSIKDFYRFTTMEKTGDVLTLTNKAVKVELAVGGREALFNNVKFIFDSKVLDHEGRYLVSRIDLAKVVDPVLRPGYIRHPRHLDTVIIDPGHGGDDFGAVNRYGAEKDYTLKLARLVEKKLVAEGLKVVLTRDADVTLSSAERVKIANRIPNAIFISIHFKSGSDPLQDGIETLTLPPVGSVEGRREARKGNVHDAANMALAASVHGSCLLITGRPDGGVRRANVSVLADASHPAILLVGGYMSHPFEARLIINAQYQQTLASGIASGVAKFRMATNPNMPNPR